MVKDLSAVDLYLKQMDIKILSQKVHIDLQFTQKTNKDLNKE
jgi:hypothetical protein